MKERPIIFSTDMVKAILEGRKTQTRRVCTGNIWLQKSKGFHRKRLLSAELYKCTCGNVGDRLWVRETFGFDHGVVAQNRVRYKAVLVPDMFIKWKSPLFMPRWASRITLEIANIRVERLQEITPSDVIVEGIIEEVGDGLALQDKFWDLWNSLHKKEYRWEDNPWVWVIGFKRLNTKH